MDEVADPGGLEARLGATPLSKKDGRCAGPQVRARESADPSLGQISGSATETST